MPEVTGRPEPDDELGEPEQEPQPPQVELSADGDRQGDVEHPLEDEVEAHQAGERVERVSGMEERHDSDDPEDQGEESVRDSPPAVRPCRVPDLVGRGAQHDDPEEDRDRVDRGPVEAEDDDREEEPGATGDEEEPPESRRLRTLVLPDGHSWSMTRPSGSGG